MPRSITWSYGGGVQSVAIAVLVSQGKLPVPERCIIADTGREGTATWQYTDEHVRPLLRAVGLEIETASHSLATVDLYSRKGDLLMPVFTQTGKLETFCSTEWKARVVQRYLRSLGYGPQNPVTMWIGISLDEIGRAKPSRLDWQELHWPLAWDLRMRRRDCQAVIHNAGLPPAPKSSCWCCPHRRNEQWRDLRDNQPADFKAACELDKQLSAHDEQGGTFLHFSRRPLAEADLTDQPPVNPSLFGDIAACDSGYCWT